MKAPVAWIGWVTNIFDGDTILVSRVYPNGHQKRVKVRLFGVDAPERDQPFGRDSGNFLRSLVDGQKVIVSQISTDVWGRVVGIIETDSANINEEVLKNGYGWWYRYFAPHEEKYRELESQAKSSKLGLWQDDIHQAPWEWRKSHRKFHQKALDFIVGSHRGIHHY